MTNRHYLRFAYLIWKRRLHAVWTLRLIRLHLKNGQKLWWWGTQLTTLLDSRLTTSPGISASGFDLDLISTISAEIGSQLWRTAALLKMASLPGPVYVRSDSEHFHVCEKGVIFKTGSEWSPKLEVLQDFVLHRWSKVYLTSSIVGSLLEFQRRADDDCGQFADKVSDAEWKVDIICDFLCLYWHQTYETLRTWSGLNFWT